MDNKGKIGSALLYGLTWPLARLPLKFHRACGRALGRFLGKTVRYRRDEVIINLSRCFPELDYWHVRAVCDRFYEHLGKVFTEAIWFGGCTDPGRLVDSRIVRISNPEAVNRFREDGRKSGGSCITVRARICRIDSASRLIMLSGGISVPFGDVLDIRQ